MNTTLTNNSENQTEAFNAACAVVGKNLANWFDQVKRQVFAEYHEALENNEQLLRLALIEAEALARQTEYPELVFPLLAAEKAQSAVRWQFHQKYLLRSSPAYALSA
jgi:hypothetical protein